MGDLAKKTSGQRGGGGGAGRVGVRGHTCPVVRYALETLDERSKIFI